MVFDALLIPWVPLDLLEREAGKVPSIWHGFVPARVPD
jgi:hypothetical protein